MTARSERVICLLCSKGMRQQSRCQGKTRLRARDRLDAFRMRNVPSNNGTPQEPRRSLQALLVLVKPSITIVYVCDEWRLALHRLSISPVGKDSNATMNNTQFRRIVLDTPAVKSRDSNDNLAARADMTPALGSRMRSSIPMTPYARFSSPYQYPSPNC